MNTTLIFLQQYWWFIISLLGGLLVFLLFVQGGQSLLFSFGKNEQEQRMLLNLTGRKWEFTFTTLVTFGGAFFASFPLFYSTSFGGAYWVWMLILLSFILQAVSYEFQSHKGNVLGNKVYRCFLVFNGFAAPILLGTAIGTFFNGASFVVDKGAILSASMPVISYWTTPWHGLEAVANPWNVALGLAVFFLARILGTLYFLQSVSEPSIMERCRRSLLPSTLFFLLFFLAFVVHILFATGLAVDPTNGTIYPEAYKYLHNLMALPAVALTFVVGVLCVLTGIIRTLISSTYIRGIWWTGIGTVLTVLALFLIAGYNHTAYYPSVVDMQSSLTISNSSSSLFTLKVMAWVSLIIPFVLGYIIYAWRSIDTTRMNADELKNEGHY